MRPDYSQLDRCQEHVFLASGGRDSTAMILEAWSLGIDGWMLHGDTGIEKREALETLDRLHEQTGYSLVHVRPTCNVVDVLRDSFLNIPATLEANRIHGQNTRNRFGCCEDLKHKPMNRYILSECKDAILVMGLKGSDGAIHRRYRMRQLKRAHTFYRLHVTNDLLYYYPLRDCSNEDIDTVLSEFGFSKTSHSGCRVCPIFVLSTNWCKRDPATWLRSRAYARKLGIRFPSDDQTEITQFCSGMTEPTRAATSTASGNTKSSDAQ